MRQPHSSAPFPPLSRRKGRIATLLATIALVVTDGLPSFARAPADPLGEWSGMLQTIQGTCPDRAPSRLLVDTHDISFVPASGVLVLHGTRKPDTQHLHAQLLLKDMNHKPLPMVFEGQLSADGARIDGTYGTPSCRAHVTLARPVNHPLQRALGN